jgi:DnaJ domain
MSICAQLACLTPKEDAFHTLLNSVGAQEGARIVVRTGGNADGLPVVFLSAAEPADRECLLIRSVLDAVWRILPRTLYGVENWYRALGVPFWASFDAIQFSFRYLSRSYHPDTIDASLPIYRRFDRIQKEICQANQVLSSVAKRSLFDKTLLHSRYAPSNLALPSKFWFLHRSVRDTFEKRRPSTVVRRTASEEMTLQCRYRNLLGEPKI